VNIGIISLIALIVAIIAGFKFKINTGLLSIALALVVGKLGGMSDSAIISGFGASLFLMLLGVMFLFSIAQQNGTLDLIAKKAVALAGKSTYLIPIIVFIVGAVLSAVGPGAIPVMSLMAVFSMALAVEMKVNPLMLAPIALLGALGGGMSPLAPTGILGQTLSQGYDVAIPLFVNSMVGSTIYALILYFVFGGHKIKANNPMKFSDLPKFDNKQRITLIGIAVMVVLVIFFKYNVGLTAFAVSVCLLLSKVANEKKAISGVPWGTLILVSGVGLLMNVAIKLGGIDLLSAFLASFMTEVTAPAILAVTGGIMSWFSSTSGVVMPTLIPTVEGLINTLNADLNLLGPVLVSAISVSAHTAGISPISTGGSLALAAYIENSHATPEEQHILFVKLFLVAALGVLFMATFCLVGGMSWIMNFV
jgi:di/tricarboxylate transporter